MSGAFRRRCKRCVFSLLEAVPCTQVKDNDENVPLMLYNCSEAFMAVQILLVGCGVYLSSKLQALLVAHSIALGYILPIRGRCIIYVFYACAYMFGKSKKEERGLFLYVPVCC